MPDQVRMEIGGRLAYAVGRMFMLLLFVCGIANFALGKALLESRHPMLDALPPSLRRGGGRLSLLFEFLVLLGAMLLTAGGLPGAAWLYAGYTLFNVFFGLLVHTGRL